MRHIRYKLYIATQYEKEEQWLNEMSAKGMALIHAGICRYVFEDEEPGKYQYRIQLLDNLPGNGKSRAYLQFLEETGVEHIASIIRWVYLRKKVEDGPFELYSDVESTIRYLRRLRIFFFSLMFLEYFFGIQNLVIGLNFYNHIRIVNVILGILLLILGVMLTTAAWEHTKKIRQLHRELQIRE